MRSEHPGGKRVCPRAGEVPQLLEGFAGGRRRLSGAGRNEAPPPGAPVCVAGSAAESDSTMRGPKTGHSGGVVALTLDNRLEA